MNTDWQWVQLGEISEVISKGTTPTTHGVAFLDSGIPFLRAEDVVGGAVDVTSVKYYVSDKTHDTLLARSKLQPGDFLITIAGSLGRVGYVPLNAPPLNCNQAVAFVRLKPNAIDLDFLLYVFQYEGITKSLLDVQKVGTIGNLNLEQIRDFKIPLPPLTEQKRIASLLARADRLRQLRRTAHDLGDALLQSVFLEMFGDPVRNEKKWEERNLNDLCRNITDGTHDTPDRTDSGVPFITSKNIRPYEIDLSVLEYVSEETHKEILKRTNPQYGDVIYTNIGVNLGNAAMNKLPFSFSLKNVALLQPNSEVLNSYYLEALLNNERFKENLIYLSSAGGAQKFITLEVLRTISIPYPPLNLQEEFAGVVARVESLRGRMSEAGRQVEGLFESLLSQSFSN
jgi:type I restriction enzyme S subunit